MNTDLEEQEDELLALQSIFDSEAFVRDESKFAGEIRVSVELPADFRVDLLEGETQRQYAISFLPPLLLTFELPEDYPSSSPPSFTLTCSWLTHTQLSALSGQLVDLYQASGGAVVLFSWVQFLREDTLRFLNIHNLLDLPSDGHSTLQDIQHAGSSELKSYPKSKSADEQCCDAADPCKQDISTTSVEVEPNPSASNGSNSESQALPDQTDQEDLASLLPSSSSASLDPSAQGAASLSVHPRDSQNEDQTVSGLSLTPSQSLLSQILIYDAAQKQKVFDSTVFDCGVCFVGWLGSECVQLSECGHVFCQACLGEFCKVQITEGNVRHVTCPQADCTATPTPAQVKNLVGEELFSRYDRLLLQSTLDCMPDVVYCPRRSCGSAVILEKSSTAALCSVCGFAFCVICSKTFHGNNACQAQKNIMNNKGENNTRAELPQTQEGRNVLWDDYVSGSKQRKHLLESRYGRDSLLSSLASSLSDNWIDNNSKSCPRCFCKIQKNGGCNVMMCARCRLVFCWACLTRLPQRNVYAHFEDSPCSSY